MKYRGLGSVVLCAMVVAACSSGTEGGAENGEANVADTSEAIIGPSTAGGSKDVVLIYASTVNANGSLGTRTCTGSYFAPRVVVTAAHCLDNVFADQLFVYYGTNFTADFGQLGPGPNGLLPPAPGQPSTWAQADSFQQHPSYDPTLFYPDLGVIYLDRKLPFDPLPLSRNQLATNRSVTISGWGANSAPTPTTGAGSRVLRTGTTKTLGNPTAADNHPEDPNPGLNSAANRANLVKTDGTAPNANACFGDSGGPILVNDGGQTYIAGVSYFTGLSCANYGLYVRINDFLPFLDAAYQKGGQAVLTPTFDCVAPNAQGTLTAFFGYNNLNGVNVTVPYGTKNSLARDTANTRPALFTHGQHDYTFGVDFAANQTVSWTLSPDNSPTTTLTINSASKRCGAAEARQSECALACRASERSGCPALPSFETCVANCLSTYDFVDEIAPQCAPQNSALNVCTAGLSPAASNWTCDDFVGVVPGAPCQTQNDALNTCFSQ
jgi:Trypsin